MTPSLHSKSLCHLPQTGRDLRQVSLGKWPCLVWVVKRADSDYFAKERSGYFQGIHNKLVRLSDCLLADSSANIRMHSSIISTGLEFLCADFATAPSRLERMYQSMRGTESLMRSNALANYLTVYIQEKLPSFKTLAGAQEGSVFIHNGLYEAARALSSLGTSYHFFKDMAYSLDLVAKSFFPVWQVGPYSELNLIRARKHAQYCMRDLIQLSAEHADLVLQSANPQLIVFFRCKTK